MSDLNLNCLAIKFPLLHGDGVKALIVKDSDVNNKFSVCHRQTLQDGSYREEMFLCTVVSESDNPHIGSFSVRQFGCVHQPVTLVSKMRCSYNFLFLDDYVCLIDRWIVCFHATASSSSKCWNHPLDTLKWKFDKVLFHFGNVFAYSATNDYGNRSNFIVDVDKRTHEELSPSDLVSLQSVEGKFFCPSTNKVLSVNQFI